MTNELNKVDLVDDRECDYPKYNEILLKEKDVEEGVIMSSLHDDVLLTKDEVHI